MLKDGRHIGISVTFVVHKFGERKRFQVQMLLPRSPENRCIAIEIEFLFCAASRPHGSANKIEF